jgi:hypothetical protein
MSEENKALARRFLEEAFNEGNLDVVDEIILLITSCTTLPVLKESYVAPRGSRGSSRCTEALTQTPT